MHNLKARHFVPLISYFFKHQSQKKFLVRRLTAICTTTKISVSILSPQQGHFHLEPSTTVPLRGIEVWCIILFGGTPNFSCEKTKYIWWIIYKGPKLKASALSAFILWDSRNPLRETILFHRKIGNTCFMVIKQAEVNVPSTNMIQIIRAHWFIAYNKRFPTYTLSSVSGISTELESCFKMQKASRNAFICLSS